MKCAILGANGFIGTRTVERFHLEETVDVRPVVRTFASLSRASRFHLDWRIADACDEEALAHAFDGCEVVVHSAVVDPRIIPRTIEPTWRAAERAGVQRIVYLSTASVHGQSPRPGTDENSRLSVRQPLAYNNAKVLAERKLLNMHTRGSVELVILRPGIVYGPRSTWISGLAEELLAGRAYLIDEGQGIFNGIYVDNLIHAIRLAITTPHADGHAFLLGDRELVTWADFYRAVADALGVDLGKVARVASPAFKKNWHDSLGNALSSAPVRAILPLIPKKLKDAVKAAVRSLAEPPSSPWTLPGPPAPCVTRMMALLQQCHYKLPYDKARRLLGYEPSFSFAEGMRRSIGWLQFAGYPTGKEYS